jgi:8-oxo-dGTP diphosphatase
MTEQQTTEESYVAEVTQRAVLFDDSGRTLLLQYDADHGWWAFPGGRLRDGESPEEGLRREVREETGLSVEVVRPVLTRTFEWNGEPKFGVASLCRLTDGAEPDSVELSDEHRAYRWVEPEAVSELETPSDDHEKALASALRLREEIA